MSHKISLQKQEKYKDQKNLIITVGVYPKDKNSLHIFTYENWKKYQERISYLPLTNAKARAFKRVTFDFCYEAEVIDGCIALPQKHWDYLIQNKPDGEVKVYDYLKDFFEKYGYDAPGGEDCLFVVME